MVIALKMIYQVGIIRCIENNGCHLPVKKQRGSVFYKIGYVANYATQKHIDLSLCALIMWSDRISKLTKIICPT